MSTADDLRVLRERDEARAAVMRQRDKVASRARRACQILIEEIGADGPTDVDAVAERAAVLIRGLRDQVADLQAAACESLLLALAKAKASL